MNQERVLLNLITIVAIAIIMRGLEETRVLEKNTNLFVEFCVASTICSIIRLLIYYLYKLAEWIK